MKKRGFTLIELLAVIVILAVIALISIPIVLSIIEKAKKSAFLDSAYGIMKSAEAYYSEAVLEGTIEDKTFLFDQYNELKYSGTKPQGGMLVLSKKGEISLAFYNNEYCALKSKTDKKITIRDYEENKCMIPDHLKDPIIILKGEKEVRVKLGDTYSELGVEARTVDGSRLEYKTIIKKDNEIVERIDINLLGTYIITYIVESNGKKVEVSRTVKIVDGVEKPDLTNGLVPIKWNGSNWIKADENNPSGEYQWYDYKKQMWANAVSVTSEYRNVAVGTVIPESAILAYFVWIPRYEYQYTNLGTAYAGGTKEQPGEIGVNFIATTKTSPSPNYKIHPAFTFGEKELSGIWVGKFETTGTGDNPTIKPNVSSLKNQNISTQFATAQKFSASGNTYGISESVDAHMMKNSEWGVVAYLSQSKYGKYGNGSYTGANKEIYINNYNKLITGCSGGSPSAAGSSNCDYTYEKELKGTGASTTGTIYGIYDMSGGTYEYVMGVYNKTVSQSGFSSLPDSKYYDNYTTETANTACSGGICYGHALSETSGWYSDSANFVFSSKPWLLLGGGCNGTSSYAGVFHSSYYTGASGSYYSFRVVLAG